MGIQASGLSGGAFGLSLYGGVRAGTFGAVTAGTYPQSVTGETGGTARTVIVSLDSVTSSGKPTVKVRATSLDGG
ncbi:MAG TPA: hypothetical protein VGY66_18635, partial [Gemmataceae bacterium]|nr:hypothetical protein [Gemmataceae bacterium]